MPSATSSGIGLSLLDVAIAHLILRKAEAADVGTMLRFH